MNQCHFHPVTIVQEQCSECEKFLCKKCTKKHKKIIYCKDCKPSKYGVWDAIFDAIGQGIAKIIEHH